MNQATVIFAGGGTGGHLFPGIAVAEELHRLQDGFDCLFCGSNRPLEQQILESLQLEHHPLDLRPLSSAMRSPVGFFWNLMQARQQSLRLLEQVQPAAVVGLGGMASVPMISAARSAGIPTLLLEQNIVAGRATRWLSRRAGAVCCAFPDTVGLGRRTSILTTGNPVRQPIARLCDADSSAGQRLLILGGSQGSAIINTAAMQMTEQLKDRLTDWQIVHQTGREQEAAVREHYHRTGLQAEVAAFFDDLPQRYAGAGLVISRAGATTLAELACAGCPAVLLPIPNSIGDHQMANAVYFASSGAAQLVRQLPSAEATAVSLIQAVERALNHPEDVQQQRRAMRQLAMPHAARTVAEELLRQIEATR